MLPPLICHSRCLRKLRRDLRELAASSRPLLIIGERGVGKTLVARHIHALSPLSSRRLMVTNLHTLSDRDRRIAIMGAGPPELAGTRRSIFEHPTTVVLKSLHELPTYLQEAVAAILRTGTLIRPGRPTPLPARARVIMTFERSPRSLLAAGELIPSLHRVVSRSVWLRIPPLRERPADLRGLLVQWGGVTGARVQGRWRSPTLPPALLRYPWPGNGAELRAYLRSVAFLTHEEALQEHERREIARIVGMIEERHEFSLKEALRSMEHHLVERAMRQAGGRRVEAARLLGLTERDLRRKVS